MLVTLIYCAKTAEPIKMAFVGGTTHVGPRNLAFDGSRSNESILSRKGWQVGDAAFCQINLDTCLLCCRYSLQPGLWKSEVSVHYAALLFATDGRADDANLDDRSVTGNRLTSDVEVGRVRVGDSDAVLGNALVLSLVWFLAVSYLQRTWNTFD